MTRIKKELDMKNKPIGIVGGMGPLAGIALSENIINQTIAGKDQDHLPQVLFSLPGMIPDRTEYLTGKVKTNPGAIIARILTDMEGIGVSIAGMACNSVHAPRIFDSIVFHLKQKDSGIRLLHIIKEAGRFITVHYPGCRRIGILGTTGTYVTGLYEMLSEFDLETINIPVALQHNLHKAVYHPDYGIKSSPGSIHNQASGIVQDSVAWLASAGAQLIILGCTELPLIYKDPFFRDIPVIDSSVMLARAMIMAHSPKKLKTWPLHRISPGINII
jgi:aspartate racemase